MNFSPVRTSQENSLEDDVCGIGSSIDIKSAHSIEEIMQAVAIRSAVFLSEQKCPYREEFDGNDFCATHFIAYFDEEPAATLRARYFADFVKLERLAVRHEFRKNNLANLIIKFAVDHVRKKGYRRIYGHAQDRLLPFWLKFGFKVLNKNYDIRFSDFKYTEIVLDLEPDADKINLHSDPFVIIRPEGEWSQSGVLDLSSNRPVTSPLRRV